MSQLIPDPPFSSTPQTGAIAPVTLPSFPPDAIPSAPAITDPGPAAGGPAPLITQDQSSGDWYSDALLDSEYDTDPGILQAPVAGPAGTPCEIIAVHAPTATRVFEWTVERQISPPRAPHWKSNNPNEVLIGKRVRPASWIMGPDGSKIWRLSGTYNYALFLPPGDSDPLFAGVPQYASETPSSANVQASQFDTTLSDSSSTTPAGFTPSALT